MTRGEWQSIMIMLGAILFVLIMILVYLRFIWNLQCKMWDTWYASIAQLRMVNEPGSESRLRKRGMLGGEGANLLPRDRDGGEHGPGIR